MQWQTLVIAFLLGLFGLFHRKILGAIRDRMNLYSAMAKFPGPFAFPIIGAAWQFKLNMNDLTQQIMGWGMEYCSQGAGAVKLWMGPVPLLAIVHPVHAKEVLESNELITKASQYDILLPWLGTGLLTSTGDKWRQRRKMLTPAFHFKVLNDFLIVHDYQSKILLEQLKPIADSGKETDLFPYLKRMALDIICETSMGSSVDAQHNHDHQYVRSVARLNEISFAWERMPWLQLKPIWRLSGYGAEYDHHLKIVTDFTRSVIQEKWEEYQKFHVDGEEKDKKKMAFLDLLLEMRREGLMNEEDIREEVDTFMFEGHDTTSSAMGWTLWCLSHDEAAQQKVIDEVDEIFGTSDRDCTNDDLKKMKYLEKCIKESLRLFPSVPFIGRKVEKDVMINGDLFPKGASILIAPLLLQRNPMWWNNPSKFNPENFSEESLQNRHAYADVPFSAGPRNCIGQKFAIMEEKTVLSWIFRKYRVKASIPFEENHPCPEIIIKPSLGFPITVEHRLVNV